MLVVKDLYPSAESIYVTFSESEFGRNAKAHAFEEFPKYKISAGDAHKATKSILLSVSDWLYQHTPEINEIDIESSLDSYQHTLARFFLDEFKK